jgi:hypothetical protein
MARNEVDTVDTAEDPRHITSPELRDQPGTETGEIIPTDEADSLDEVHADANYNRKVMGPAADDPTIATPGTDMPPEPGPGPEDNDALDNATGGAMSAAAETGPGIGLAAPNKDDYKNRDLAARNLGQITTTFDMNAPGEREGAALAGDGTDVDNGEDDGFDPGEHTVAEVEEFIAENPELREDVIAAERQGKNRSSIVG